MSLITEEKRKELHSKTAEELKRDGYMLSWNLRSALEEKMFYALVACTVKEAAKKTGKAFSTCQNYRHSLVVNNLVEKRC